MPDPVCPACGAALAKAPQRKTKCKACGEFMFVKGTPDDRIKRPMTAAQAKAADELWAHHQAEVAVDALGANRGFSADEWRHQIATQGGLFPPGRHPFPAPNRDPNNLLFAQAYEDQRKFLVKEMGTPPNGGMVYEIRRHQPFAPAAQMRELYAAGKDFLTISRISGYAVQTVADTLATGGIHPRVGPQCDALDGVRLTLDEALSRMPLPCGAGCVCWWRYVYPQPRPDPGAQMIRSIKARPPMSPADVEQARQAWSATLGIDISTPAKSGVSAPNLDEAQHAWAKLPVDDAAPAAPAPPLFASARFAQAEGVAVQPKATSPRPWWRRLLGLK